MLVEIGLRQDTTANWDGFNPTLAAGEWGVETITGSDYVKIKIGDNVTPWKQLPYQIDFTAIQNIGTAAASAASNAAASATSAQAAAAQAVNVAKDYLQRSTAYTVGDIIPAADNLSKAYALLCTGCTTAGGTPTTGATAPTTWAAVGGSTTDGTAVFMTIARQPFLIIDGALNITYTE